jgi:hypothetical protein
MTSYFLSRGDRPEVEVTKEEFVSAERNAGFYNTVGEPDEPATGSFSTHTRGEEGISGRIQYG